ncbi:MAG TPA: hypothetical protein VGK48_07150 [Terriglobia bacterium]
MPPVRSGPIRNPLSAFLRPSAPEESREQPKSGTPADGALENGVRTAYEVIEEYLRRGYQAANNNNSYQDRRGPMNDKRANNYGWQNPWGAMPPFTEQWLMAMRTWMDAWSSFVPGGWPQQAWNPAGAASAQAQTTPAVAIQLLSTRPAEVIANLGPGADHSEIMVDPLFRQGAPEPLSGDAVSISRTPGRVVVTVKIDSGQPAGCYYGSIRSIGDRRTVGDLTVVIHESRGD